jgi:uncharacterized protein (TIGR03086 family)
VDPLETLRRASVAFESRVKAVTIDQWNLPTLCEPWTVRDLIGHVIAGNRMAVLLLAGGTADEAAAARGEDPLGSDSLGGDPFGGDPLCADPVGAYLSSAAEQVAAFAEPGALDRNCHHPDGDMPGVQLLGYRVTELALHAWDLSRATKLDEELDAELVEKIWEAMAPMAPMIPQTGHFGSGPSGAVDDDAPLQTRLLDLSGRRP